ncbi:MAG: DUF2269 family protein, partial [Rhodospirillaceae bacterium]
MSYETAKLIHLAGVVLFLGNIVVTALWKTLADRKGDAGVIRFAHRLVIVTDWAFTGGGAALLSLGAGGMVWIAGPDLFTETWVMVGTVLFGISGLLWASVLIPIQAAQARVLRDAADPAAVPNAYWAMARRWTVFVIAATVLVAVNLS